MAKQITQRGINKVVLATGCTDAEAVSALLVSVNAAAAVQSIRSARIAFTPSVARAGGVVLYGQEAVKWVTQSLITGKMIVRSGMAMFEVEECELHMQG